MQSRGLLVMLRAPHSAAMTYSRAWPLVRVSVSRGLLFALVNHLNPLCRGNVPLVPILVLVPVCTSPQWIQTGYMCHEQIPDCRKKPGYKPPPVQNTPIPRILHLIWIRHSRSHSSSLPSAPFISLSPHVHCPSVVVCCAPPPYPLHALP